MSANLSRTLVLVFLLAGVFVPGTGLSQRTGDFDQEEYRALPRVCHAQKFIHAALRPPLVSDTEREQWAKSLGVDDFRHFHHYCWALMSMSRASVARTPREREFNYRRAVNDFTYVQRNASPQFPMMPEVNLRKGLALALLGEQAAAASEFVGAIKLKPDYSPAYAALADVYLDLKDLQAAKETIATGLSRAPDSKLLAQKRDELETLSAKP